MLNVPILESYWVAPDQFLAGAYPSSRDERFSSQTISALLAAGITDFINLTQPHEMPPYEPLLHELAPLYDLTPRHTRIPFRDGGIPYAEDMKKILDLIDAAIHNGRKVYAHCWGGIGRTGVTVGCYLVRHGETPARAVERVNALYHTRPRNIFYPRSPESDEQVQFILDWREP